MNEEICSNCNRNTKFKRELNNNVFHNRLVKAYAVHTYYGCDTGCCGYIAVAEDENLIKCRSKFEFDHNYGPDEQNESWANSFTQQFFPGIPFSWEDCEMVND